VTTTWLHRPVGAVVLLASFAACGTPAAPPKPPTAEEVLAKPEHSGLKDAHFLATGKFTNQGVTVAISGDGELVYGSGAGRFKFQTSVAGQPISFEEISAGGTDYTFTVPGNGKWTARATTSGIGPDSFNGASAFTYIGEEALPQGKSWHVKAQDKDGNPFDGWIRERDGYPVKYMITQQGNALTLAFDKYNTGATITAPPSSQVVQG
jgi:hypothetical protein